MNAIGRYLNVKSLGKCSEVEERSVRVLVVRADGLIGLYPVWLFPGMTQNVTVTCTRVFVAGGG